MQEQRCFVNPDDDECQINNNEFNQEIRGDGREQIQLFQDQDAEDCGLQIGKNQGFVSAESEFVGATPKMLETIKEVAEELLATSIIPFRREGGCRVLTESQLKARGKLMKLGLNEVQINKLIEFQIKKQKNQLESNKKKQGSKNLVYQATRKLRKQKQNVHTKQMFRKKV